MEQEKFISGYCRQLDASRMVEVVAENGEIKQTEENESVEVSKENNFELENINRKSKND